MLRPCATLPFLSVSNQYLPAGNAGHGYQRLVGVDAVDSYGASTRLLSPLVVGDNNFPLPILYDQHFK